MAKASVFNQAALQLIDSEAKGVIKSAKDSVSPFANFKGPIGRYYARLRRIAGKPGNKPGVLNIIFYHTCLARIPDSSSATAVPDQEFAGEAMRIWCSTGATAKQSKEEAWERTMQTIQAYDIKTGKFGMRDGAYDPTLVSLDMATALDGLNELSPAVIIEVSAGKSGGQFLNVREIVDESVVARFGRPTMEITDEMIGTLPEEVETAAAEEVPLSEDEYRQMANEYDKQGLVQLINTGIESKALSFDLPCGPEMLSLEDLVEIFVADCMGRPCPKLSVPCTEPTPENTPAPPVTSFAADDPTVGTVDDDDEEGPAADDDEEEAAPVVADDSANKLMAFQLKISTEDRATLKKRLRAMGALKPEDKFLSTQTDEELRQWAVDVFTGVRPPVIAAVPFDLDL